MPRDIRCPLCRAVFSPANAESDRIRCPACREVIDLDEVDSRRPTRNRRDDDDDFEEPRRRSSGRSNRGHSSGSLMPLFIFGGVFAAFLALGAVGFAIYSIANAKRQFTTFQPPGGQCSILMPGTPKEETKMIGDIQVRGFTVQDRRGFYAIAYSKLKPGTPFNWNGGIGGVATSNNATVIHQEVHGGPNGGYAEFELEKQNPHLYGAGRIVYVRGRLYEYFALGRNARLSNPEVRAFIDSFKVEDGPLPWEQQPAQPFAPPAKTPSPNKPKPFAQPEFPEPNPQLIPRQLDSPVPAREDTIGSNFGPKQQDDAPAGGLLIGFEIGYSKFGNNLTIGTLKPIYRIGDRETTGATYGKEAPAGNAKLVARPGYAVGAITARAGLCIDGFSVTFMKIDGGFLNPKDAYESEWCGGMGGGGPQQIAGQGAPATGLLIRHQAEVSAIGLVFDKK